MKSRRRGRRRWNIPVLCISCALALNIIGISYAAWSDGLTAISDLTMGELDVEFGTVYRGMESTHKIPGLKIKSKNKKLDLSTRRKGIAHDQREVVIVDIKNTGTIPIALEDIFDEQNIEDIEIIDSISFNDEFTELRIVIDTDCDTVCDHSKVNNYLDELAQMATEMIYIAPELDAQPQEQAEQIQTEKNDITIDELEMRCQPPSEIYDFDLRIPVVQKNLWQGGD